MSTPSTPPRPPSPPGRAPRRRSTGIRRPRVAGHAPGSGARPEPTPAGGLDVLDGTADADLLFGDPGPRVDLRKSASASPGGDDRADGAGDPAADGGTRPSGKRLVRRHRSGGVRRARPQRRSVPTVVLAGAAVLLVAAAAFFAVQNALLRGTPAAQNTALVDVGATAQVTQQVSDALAKVYSFDYTRLDQNEAAAKSVITPSFQSQFASLFQQVRELAPQQKAVVTATVNTAAVRSINGDTAVLLVFLDQQATRAADGGQAQQLAAAGRLTVTAQLVGGVWKIANVVPQ